jgi:mRNA-degrading endonuclease RelE of RelBE toxin-antitoxin system
MVIPRPGSELKAVEEACREASRTVEPLNGWIDLNGLQHSLAANSTGDYRVVYEIDDARKRVRIFRIRHRREVYR